MCRCSVGISMTPASSLRSPVSTAARSIEFLLTSTFLPYPSVRQDTALVLFLQTPWHPPPWERTGVQHERDNLSRETLLNMPWFRIPLGPTRQRMNRMHDKGRLHRDPSPQLVGNTLTLLKCTRVMLIKTTELFSQLPRLAVLPEMLKILIERI